MLLLGCLSIIPAAAQRNLSGTVCDSNGEPLIGATVSVEGRKGLGAVTDLSGKYQLRLPEKHQTYILKVRFVGYVTESRSISPQDRTADFRLKEDAIGMETVVVTGTRTPKRLKEVPVITRVITLDDIRKTDATNIVDVLEMEMPAIETSYSMDMQPSLNIQGFSGNAVLFLVDGERLAGETMNDVDFSRLNMDNVERVEIVRGAASSIYGSNAVGGVINLIPRTSTEPWTANVNARYGAYNNQRYGTTVSFRAGNFNNSFNLQRLSQGRIEYFNPDTEGDKGSYDSMDPTASWNFKDRLTFTPNNQLKLTANVGYYYRERERSSSEDNRYRDFTGGLKGRYLFSKGQSLEVSYAFDQYDKSDFDKVKRSDVRDYSNVQNSFRALYNHTFNGKHILTVGGDYLYDYLASYMFSGGETYRQYTADAFAQFDWNPNRHFNAVASARYDYYSEAKAQNFSPQLNLMYKLRNCSLRGSYAVGFRAPTLKEMYSAFDMGSIWWIYGNEHLKPEKSHNFSLSAEYFKSRYNLTVTGYYNLVNDRIDVQWDPSLENGKGAMMYTNIRKMKMAGANVDAAAKYPCGLEIRLSYAYTYQSEKYNQYVSTARPHAGTARFSYGKEWKKYGFNVTLSGRLLSKLTTLVYNDTSDPSKGSSQETYPAYTMWKLNLTQNIYKGIHVTLTADNLFNYRPSYYYFNSPYTTGTTLAAGVSVDLDRLF